MHVAQETIVLAAGFDIADIFPSCTFLHFVSGTTPTLKKLYQENDNIPENIITEYREARGTTTRKGEAIEDLIDVL